jgi:hypothetical protein
VQQQQQEEGAAAVQQQQQKDAAAVQQQEQGELSDADYLEKLGLPISSETLRNLWAMKAMKAKK